MCTFNLRMMLGEQKPEGRPQSSSQWAHIISLFSRCFTYQQDTVSQGVLSACVTLIYKNAPSFNTTMADNRLSILNPSWKKNKQHTMHTITTASLTAQTNYSEASAKKILNVMTLTRFRNIQFQPHPTHSWNRLKKNETQLRLLKSTK